MSLARSLSSDLGAPTISHSLTLLATKLFPPIPSVSSFFTFIFDERFEDSDSPVLMLLGSGLLDDGNRALDAGLGRAGSAGGLSSASHSRPFSGGNPAFPPWSSELLNSAT